MPQHIVVHLTHAADDLTATAMALRLASTLQRKGAQVTVFLDLEGARIADTRQPLDLLTRRGKPIIELYNALVQAGGSLMVCPHCAGSIGLTSETLRPGASIAANDDELADMILKADKILDY